MRKYKINTPTETDNSHIVRRIMIGTPLLLALVFSFGFVLVRPMPIDHTRSATSGEAPKTVGQDDDFGPASKEPTNLPVLSQLPPSDAGSPSTSAADSMAAPQSTSGSGRSSASPQAGTAGGQSIDPNRSIPVKVELPTSALTNLLR